jgi:hypothetical protein
MFSNAALARKPGSFGLQVSPYTGLKDGNGQDAKIGTGMKRKG